MDHSLCLHTTHDGIALALARCGCVLATSKVGRAQASAHLVTAIAAILEENGCCIADVAHLVVTRGPAPFTTLRTVIATANGISFARGIPLVGINALEALADEYAESAHHFVALLDAFNDAVYYCIDDKTTRKRLVGCANLPALLVDLARDYQDKEVMFFGSGARLYEANIRAAGGLRPSVVGHDVHGASLGHIAQVGHDEWMAGRCVLKGHPLEPLYIKKPLA